MLESLYSLELRVRELLVERMDIAGDGGIAAAVAILPLGLVFGALHALTPGHSKSVLASYLLGTGKSLKRSLFVASTLSVTHVGMAVLLAVLGAPLIQKTLIGAGRAPSIEFVSRGIIIAVGLWLIARAVWRTSHTAREGRSFGIVAGLIPCPLTLFVMFAAIRRDTIELGFLWAFAMAGGVMLTLGLVAALTSFSRTLLLRLLDSHMHRVEQASRVIEGLSGVLLIVLAARELL